MWVCFGCALCVCSIRVLFVCACVYMCVCFVCVFCVCSIRVLYPCALGVLCVCALSVYVYVPPLPPSLSLTSFPPSVPVSQAVWRLLSPLLSPPFPCPLDSSLLLLGASLLLCSLPCPLDPLWQDCYSRWLALLPPSPSPTASPFSPSPQPCNQTLVLQHLLTLVHSHWPLPSPLQPPTLRVLAQVSAGLTGQEGQWKQPTPLISHMALFHVLCVWW